MTEQVAAYDGVVRRAWPAAPMSRGTCAVCATDLMEAQEAAAALCWRCQEWPAPLLEAHLNADAESRERVKVRMIATGGNQFEFRVCRIGGDWLAVDDTRHDATFWVARGQIVTVWEERV